MLLLFSLVGFDVLLFFEPKQTNKWERRSRLGLVGTVSFGTLSGASVGSGDDPDTRKIVVTSTCADYVLYQQNLSDIINDWRFHTIFLLNLQYECNKSPPRDGSIISAAFGTSDESECAHAAYARGNVALSLSFSCTKEILLWCSMKPMWWMCPKRVKEAHG